MPRIWITLIGILLVITGCSSQSTASNTLVPDPTKTYTDTAYNFSFKYPATWSVKSHTMSVASAGNPRIYIVHLNVPGNAAGMEVTVSGTVTPFPPITDGEVRKDPSGPSSFRYFNKTVSGFPALRVERFYQGQTDQITTIINGHKRTYAVRMLTATPPFKAAALTGYGVIVRTLSLPFS